MPVKVPNEMISLFEKYFGLVKRKDTDVVVTNLDRGIFTPDQGARFGLRFLNNREILRCKLQAEKEGFDGILNTCFFDPALKPAKQLLHIPVVGMAEAAYHFATMMGLKFAVVTDEERWVPEMIATLEEYKMRNHAIERKPIRVLTLPRDELTEGYKGNYSLVTNNYKEIAASCIEDGAEVLITGSGALAPIITLGGLREVAGAPIVDPELVGLKTLEMLVDLNKAGLPYVSRKGLYAEVPAKEVDELMTELNMRI